VEALRLRENVGNRLNTSSKPSSIFQVIGTSALEVAVLRTTSASDFGG
jgi:hypothetical protein